VLIGKPEPLLVEKVSGDPVADMGGHQNTHLHATLQLPSPAMGPDFDHRYPSVHN
jgi:hypothetical protein